MPRRLWAHGPARRRVLIAIVGLVAVTTLPLAQALGKKGDAQLVSRQSKSAGGFAANDESGGPAISGNGRIVAYSTDATNLGGPIDASDNIYVYDPKRKRVSLVSRRSKAAGGAAANADSFAPDLNSDGRFVAFETDADNLGNGDNSLTKVYVYDRKRKRVALISRQSKSAGGAVATGNSHTAGISRDGRLIAFTTPADNVGGPIDTNVSNLYVYDRRTKRAQLVSRRSKSAGGTGHNGNIPTKADLSASGRFAVFPSQATNLPGPTNAGTNCYVYDRKAKKVELVSRRSKSGGGDGANADCSNPRISGDGRFVAMNTRATNLGGDNTVGKLKVYVYDRERDRIELVSKRKQGGPSANDFSEIGSISDNGRFVGFDTDANNLGGPIDTDFIQSYVYDRKRDRARLVSQRSKSIGGGEANGHSFHPSPSASGRFVAFPTNATNLGGPVVMASAQIYVFDLLGP
jgi:Tol biopolymer transport system component